ncbi:hypothetical protein ACHAXR_009622 [Thalassiosira sp. AJA248-18]
MPPTKPRRKRKLERKSDDDPSGFILDQKEEGSNRSADDGAEKSQKRPCRGRKAMGDHGSSGSSNVRHEVHIGADNRTNGQSASLNNEMPSARSSSASPEFVPVSSQLRSTQRPIASANAKAGNSASSGGVSSLSQHLRRLAQDSIQIGGDLQSEGWDRERRDRAADTATHLASYNINSIARLTVEKDDFSTYKYAVALDRERRKWKFLLLFSVVYTAVILFAFSSIIYVIVFDHHLATLKRDARVSMAAQIQSQIIQREMHKHKRTRIILRSVHERLDDSQEMVMKLQNELAHTTQTYTDQILEYKSIVQQHEEELSDAVERINLLRGDKEESNSALDLAWLRIDEFMEENNELSNGLKKERARNRELGNTVELLTGQLQVVTHKKDKWNKLHDDLLDRSIVLTTKHDLLQHNHNEMAEAFLAPILVYIQKLQRTTEQQHSIILELTSLVHSLHSSLEITKENLETQATESMHAVDAVAVATNDFILAKTVSYEMEREHYMQHMEMQLERLEDEAMGAVQAVATAAGKLEYERKIEEEGRWRSYVNEAETILGGIRDNIQENGSTRDNDNIVGNNLVGIGESSVLRAAISRRIEVGIASLRSYMHPYNYLKEREDDAADDADDDDDDRIQSTIGGDRESETCHDE